MKSYFSQVQALSNENNLSPRSSNGIININGKLNFANLTDTPFLIFDRRLLTDMQYLHLANQLCGFAFQTKAKTLKFRCKSLVTNIRCLQSRNVISVAICLYYRTIRSILFLLLDTKTKSKQKQQQQNHQHSRYRPSFCCDLKPVVHSNGTQLHLALCGKIRTLPPVSI